MTDAERTTLAERLLAVIFAYRPDNGEVGQAWVLTVLSAALSGAILASVGPQGEAEPLLAIVTTQVRTVIADAQAKFFRDRLTAVPGRRPA